MAAELYRGIPLACATLPVVSLAKNPQKNQPPVLLMAPVVYFCRTRRVARSISSFQFEPCWNVRQNDRTAIQSGGAVRYRYTVLYRIRAL